MSDTWLTADPLISAPLLHGILISLSFFFIWIEWKRQSPYLALRVSAALLMMLALAGLLFRPLFKTRESEQIILLTPGYSISQADSLLDLYPTMNVFHMADAEPYRNAVGVKSYHDLSEKQDDISFVVGWGLPSAAMDLFESHRYQFIPSAYPEGIVRISIPGPMVPNRLATLEGVYNNPSKDLELFLVGPGGKEDSASFTENGFQHFKLSFLPKAHGNFIYTIQSANNIDEKFPVRVHEAQALDILIIHDYPTFETRYLKEFLVRSHRLVLRYRLSKNRYRHEFINREPRKVNRLTKESLSDFDLLIIDSDALQSLRPSEAKNLASAIEEGLGILPIFNSSPAQEKDIIPFRFTRHARDTAHISSSGRDKIILPAWEFSVLPDAGIIPILKNKSRILSGYRYKGLGKIGFQLLQDTYRLTLQGDSIAYSALWSDLLEEISRTTNGEFTPHQKSKFPLFPDAPVTVEIVSSGNAPVVSINNIRVPVEESVLVDDLWKAKFWSGKPGWNQLTVGEGTALDLYVSEESEWRAVAVANTLDQTRLAASSTPTELKIRAAFLPVPAWIFYFLFLLAAGALWLAPKL